jgi:hypothetical protein
MSKDRYTTEANAETDEFEIRDGDACDEFERPRVIGTLKSGDQAEKLVIALNNPSGGYSFDHSRQDGRATLAILDGDDNTVAHFHPADIDSVEDLTNRCNGL